MGEKISSTAVLYIHSSLCDFNASPDFGWFFKKHANIDNTIKFLYHICIQTCSLVFYSNIMQRHKLPYYSVQLISLKIAFRFALLPQLESVISCHGNLTNLVHREPLISMFEGTNISRLTLIAWLRSSPCCGGCASPEKRPTVASNRL